MEVLTSSLVIVKSALNSMDVTNKVAADIMDDFSYTSVNNFPTTNCMNLPNPDGVIPYGGLVKVRMENLWNDHRGGVMGFGTIFSMDLI